VLSVSCSGEGWRRLWWLRVWIWRDIGEIVLLNVVELCVNL
jgi:hypothetical protein